jgi:3-methylcrotonyl-CoA carboxylase alpha subunit
VKTYRVRVGPDEMDVTVGEETDGILRVSLAGSTHRVDLAEVVPGRFSFVVDGQSHDLGVEPEKDSGSAPRASGRGGGQRGWTVMVDGQSYVAEVGSQTRASGMASGQAARHGSGVRAPMPGLLVALHVTEGATVAAGQPLLIMEAMKMQMEIRASRAGTVRRVHVTAGQEIAGDQLLVTIE